MSFDNQARRQRPARYPATGQYENGYGTPSAPRRRAPWADPWERGGPGARTQLPPWEISPRQSPGARQSVRSTGARRPARNTGGQQSVRNTGALPSVWDTDARRAARDTGARRAGRGNPMPRAGRGLLGGGIAGFLAAAAVLGVANLAAAFVRPQASPIVAVGGAFVDHAPRALKNFAVGEFGGNGKNMLLLGMYVTIALIAIVIGMLASRRLWIGVAGMGLFGLFGAFAAIMRPESHVTDVIPSIAGGIAGIAAVVYLAGRRAPRSRRTPAAQARRTARHAQA